MVGLLPLAAVTTLGAGDAGAAARLHAGASRGSRAARPGGARGRAAHGRPRRTPAGGMLSIVDEERLRRILGADARPGRVPLRTTGCARCRASTAAHPLHVELNGRSSRRSTTSRAKSTTAPVRRQLQLARADLVPGQLPARRGAARLPPLPRRRLHGRVPDAAPARSSRCAQVADDLSARLIAIFLDRRERPPPGVRRLRAVPDRPGLARPDPVPRVLPRRHGAGLGASHQTGWTGLVADLIIHQASLREQPTP